jgi:hypothetical protein
MKISRKKMGINRYLPVLLLTSEKTGPDGGPFFDDGWKISRRKKC